MNHTTQHTMKKERELMSLSRMLTLFTLTIALSMFGATTWADDDDRGYGHDPKSHLERLTKKLDLTKEQQDKILPIIEEKHQRMQGLHEQMKEIRQQAMGKIEAELTPEQQEKWKKMQEERQEKMKEYQEKHGKGDKKGKHDKGDKHE
jgi:Spy/CpxP family protein refolding chaperone